MVHIIHVIIGLNVGGAEMALKRLVESFDGDVNLHHSVISLTELGSIGSELRASGTRVDVLHLQNILGTPVILGRLFLLFRQLRPDVVQTWMYHADLLGGLAARFAGCKNIIWGIRNTELAGGSSRLTVGIRWVCAKLSRWVPRTIVCVATASQRLHVALGYDATRMVVVPNGFDLALLTATTPQVEGLRRECGFTAEDVVVGTVGRFNMAKDQLNFVQAAGLVAQQFPEAKFMMVGRGCDASNAVLVDWLKSSGVYGRSVLLGERKDVPVCLAAMDVFCLPSRAEGFPNVLGEAMAMRRACVVTDVGDAATLLSDCGVVVPKECAPALAEGLAQMVALPPSERAALGMRARMRIESSFSMAQTRQRFQSLYDAATRTDGYSQEGNH